MAGWSIDIENVSQRIWIIGCYNGSEYKATVIRTNARVWSNDKVRTERNDTTMFGPNTGFGL
jgi:hypothetical protein